jgi:hypothetical protein
MNITVVDLYGNQDSIHKSQKSPKKNNKSSALEQDDAASIDSVNKSFNIYRKEPIRSFLSKLSNRIVFAFRIIFTTASTNNDNNNSNNRKKKKYKKITEV